MRIASIINLKKVKGEGMKPEQICVSLELAKRMRKLGWPQDKSFFVWQGTTQGYVLRDWENRNEVMGYFVAPTVGEIGMALPDLCMSSRHEGKWKCLGAFGMTEGKTEADARGKMWCYLKERGLG